MGKTSKNFSEEIFYKSMDENLRGRNGFQYTVGGIFEPDERNKKDDWHWLYFSKYLSSTLIHTKGRPPRICIVRPLGRVFKEKAKADGYSELPRT